MKLGHFTYTVLLAFCFALCGSSLLAQTPTPLSFEVASVKSLPPMETLAQEIASGKRSSAGLFEATVNGARFDIGMASLTGLITRAYSVQPYQIVGPGWMHSQLFEIHAKIPEVATKDQIPQMLQTLLAERFKLATHLEKKEQPVYALTVSKDGHKLKEAVQTDKSSDSGEDPAKTSPAPGKEETISGPFGKVTVSSAKYGQVKISTGKNGTRVTEYPKMTMAELAAMLTQYEDRPVVDMTELKGFYQVALEISAQDQTNMLRKQMPNLFLNSGGSNAPAGVAPGSGLSGVAASDPSGGGIIRSVQRLGLELDSRKAPVDTLVIDHIEKIPTDD